MDVYDYSKFLCLPGFLSSKEFSFNIFENSKVTQFAISSEFKEEKMICSICLNECYKPYTPDSCTHVFCKDCLYSWKSFKKVCPNCRKIFKKIKKYKYLFK